MCNMERPPTADLGGLGRTERWLLLSLLSIHDGLERGWRDRLSEKTEASSARRAYWTNTNRDPGQSKKKPEAVGKLCVMECSCSDWRERTYSSG